MNVLIENIKALVTATPLENFTWEVPDNCPVTIPAEITGSYNRNEYLKDNFASSLGHLNNDHLYWIINQWGGIGSFKRTEKNDALLKVFKDQLGAGRLRKASFERISSLSKVASFLEPTNYVIYDSRAIYSLNWLIYLYANHLPLYPQPSGRNSEIASIDCKTIFALHNPKVQYHSFKTAYHSYCELIRQLNIAVFEDSRRPYKLEMLLFMLAPTYIVNQIRSIITVKIDCGA